MSNLGNMVTNLIVDASQHTAGTNIARGNNRALSGSIDSIIGQLERQKRAMANSQATTQGNILKTAEKGAGEGSINVALQLNEDVEALKRAKAAQEALAASKAASEKAGQSLIVTLKNELATYGMTTSEINQYKAAQAGATAEDRKAASVIQWKIGEQQRFDRQIQKQITSQRAATAETGGMSRSSMLLTESLRGAEDAVAGFTNNGLKGMLMATTNNINQIGSMLGGNAGLMLSFGSIAALIGVSLVPMLMKLADGNNDVKKTVEELDSASKKAHDNEMKRMDERQQRVNTRNRRDRELQEKLFSPDTTASDLMSEERRVQEDAERAREEQDIQRKKADKNRARIGDLQNQNAMVHADPADVKRRKEEIARLEEEEKEAQIKRKQAQIDERIAQEREGIIREERLRQEAREQGAKDNEAAWEEEERQKKEKKDALTKNIQEQKTLAGTLAQTVSNLDPSSTDTRAIEARRKEIEKARAGGLITNAEAGTLNAANKAKPETLPGNVAAIQAGTKEAYSAVLRAMRNNEQSKLQADAKKLAEEANTILERIEKNTAEKEAQLLLEF